jgi:hypothetical protein
MILIWIDRHARALLCVALALIFLLAGVLLWGKLHPPRPITYESRQQASTPAGVEKAANAAQVPISAVQATAIASAIKEDENKPPDAVVQTTVAKLQETVQAELKKSGGQFAIVTDSNKDSASNTAPLPADSKTPATSDIAKNALADVKAILPNTPVMLNQYNIKVYPDRLIQVGGSYQEVFAAYSWRVSVPKIPVIAPHGDVGYLGVYGHANLDRPDMSRIGIVLTIPK